MATKHSKVVTHYEGFALISSYNRLIPFIHGRLREKTKTLHFYYYNAYGDKTYQGGNMPRGAPIHKFVWTLSEVVMWGYVKN